MHVPRCNFAHVWVPHYPPPRSLPFLPAPLPFIMMNISTEFILKLGGGFKS